MKLKNIFMLALCAHVGTNFASQEPVEIEDIEDVFLNICVQDQDEKGLKAALKDSVSYGKGYGCAIDYAFSQLLVQEPSLKRNELFKVFATYVPENFLISRELLPERWLTLLSSENEQAQRLKQFSSTVYDKDLLEKVRDEVSRRGGRDNCVQVLDKRISTLNLMPSSVVESKK